MKYPVISFTKNDKKIWSMDSLIADKRVLKTRDDWNSNIQIIDSEGQLYFIKSLEQDSSVLFWESIKSVGLMVKVKPIFEKESEEITLENLKIRVKNHVRKNKNFWSAVDDGRGLDTIIDDTTTFEELITIFR